MLSVFPSLLSWNQLAPLLTRLALGAVFVFWSYKAFKKPSKTSKDKTIAGIEGLAGILMILGLWTQIGALVAIIDLLVRLYERAKNKAFLTDGVNYYLLLLVMALGLMVTGAGMIAFDYPL